jgi:hypothetical protein
MVSRAFELAELANGLRVDLNGDVTEVQLDTDPVDEGANNLYFTVERARNSISVTGDLSYDPATGVISTQGLASSTTDDLTEGTSNLYFTDERVDDRVAALLQAGSGISITYDDPSNTLTINSSGTITDVGAIENVDYIDFTPVDPGPSQTNGRVYFNNEYKALSVYNDIVGSSLQVGHEEWIRVYNNTGSTITNGTPVYITGAIGETPTVAPADATTEEKSQVVGVVTADILNNNEGVATVRGLLSGIDTSNLTPGQRVHVNENGTLQTLAPTYPYWPVDIGTCIVSDNVNGYIYVSIIEHTFEQLRVSGNTHLDGNLTVDGNFTVNGTQSIVSQNNLSVNDSFIYLNTGDNIGEDGTTFTGTGLNDAYFTGYYEGTTSTTYYVRIDGVGTGTGGVDTFEWSTDNFVTTQATGVDITADNQELSDNIKIFFNASVGHTLNDTWSGTASPVNVDTGWSTNRNTGATGPGYTHMGVFFDVTDDKFKFFDEYGPEPEGVIDVADPSFNLAHVQARTLEATNLIGTLTGDVFGTATNANNLNNQAPSYYLDWTNTTNKPDTEITVNLTGTVTGSGVHTFTDLANGTISVATTIPGTTDLTLGDLIVTGDLTVQGTTVTQNTSTVSSDAPLIILNQAAGSLPDLGVVGRYTEAGTDYSSGLFRDASDGIWKLFDTYTPSVADNSVINVNDASYSLATIKAAEFDGALDWSNVANKPDPNITVTLTGDVVGSGNNTFTDLTSGTISFATEIPDTTELTLAGLIINGDLQVNGTTTTVNQTTLTVQDSKIFLADGNPSDAIDVGLVLNYNDGADQTSILYRDATDGKLKYIVDYNPLSISGTINPLDPTYSLGTIVADVFEGNLTGQVSDLSNHTLDSLGDVNLTVSPTQGQSIIWDSVNSEWIAGDSFNQADFDAALSAASIDDLSDVDTSTVAPLRGQTLIYDDQTNNWIPGASSGGGNTLFTFLNL